MSAGTAVTWKLDWGWRSPLQGSSLTWLASWWGLLVEDPIPYRVDLSKAFLHVLMLWQLAFPKVSSRGEKARRKSQCLLRARLRNHTASFPQLYWSHEPAWFREDKDYTGHDCQDAGVPGGCLKGYQPQFSGRVWYLNPSNLAPESAFTTKYICLSVAKGGHICKTDLIF